MNILFLTDNFPPEVNAPATRTFEHCRRWVEHGHRVAVVTGFPNYPMGRIYPGYRNRLFQREKIEGIDVLRVWTLIAVNEGFFKRTIDYLSFALTGTIGGCLSGPVDVVISTSPQIFCAVAGFIVSSFVGKPWIFELRDLWPESIGEVGASNNPLLLGSVDRFVRFLYRRSDHIVALTDSFREVLLGKNIENEKITVIPNGVPINQDRSKDGELIGTICPETDGKFVCGYIGTIGMAHNVGIIVEVAKYCRNEGLDDVHFLLVGDGADWTKVKSLVDKYGLSNVTLTGQLDRRAAAVCLKRCDLVFVVLKDKPLFRTVIPSKIFEAAAAGKPIVLAVEGEAKLLIEHYHAGIAVPPEKALALYSALVRLRGDEVLRKELGRGSLNLAMAYDRGALADRMLVVVEKLVSMKSVQ